MRAGSMSFHFYKDDGLENIECGSFACCYCHRLWRIRVGTNTCSNRGELISIGKFEARCIENTILNQSNKYLL